MKRCTFLYCVFLSVMALAQEQKPASGYVPDSRTAVKIAEAVLMPVYGEKHIESERPFKATLKDNTWTVAGTLHCPKGKGKKSDMICMGGVATVQIAKDDARILSMVHYK